MNNSLALQLKQSTSSTTLTNNSAKKKKKSKVLFWANECKYPVILEHVKSIGWKLIDDERLESKVNCYWIDVASINEHFRTIQPWQTINHFPGMPNIARKNRMGQNLNKMLKLYPREYAFYPRTWILPTELADFRNQFDNLGNSINNKIFIIKPDAGCQGRGIFLTKTYDNVPFTESVVAQMYIKKPLLLDGYKFDLRIYCLVSSVRPLRMYLFHDGLVRMCTEEYVKPTKSNLANSCMHLTNYAVNKHNENFQQSNAQTSDEGSKRSLLWFMNYIRKERGDAKANWLWRRMGTLCTRTILSIMPTLSREYEQHFKSFDNVPYDPKDINDYKKNNNTNSTNNGNNSDNNNTINTSRANKSSKNRINNSNNNNGQSEAESDEEEEDNDGDNNDNNEDSDTGGNNNENDQQQSGANDQSDTNSEANQPKTPKIRGSRCFEVLGFDIMIDSNLKPWLIEVNHLPSFGTDSALDKDIKERLMQQVFSVLPCMGDDFQTYQAHHKAESEKRLNSLRKQQQAENEFKSKPPPKRPIATAPKKELSETSLQTSNTSDPIPSTQDFANNPSDASVNPDAPMNPTPDEYDEEECTPERIQEIKSILSEIYEKFSSEKISKIDRLLVKYSGHEEEFLRFVYSKYNVTPPGKSGPLLASEEEKPLTANDLSSVLSKSTSNITPKPPTQKDVTWSKSDLLYKNVWSAQSDYHATKNPTNKNTVSFGLSLRTNQTNLSVRDEYQSKSVPKRYSRSLSPPRSTTQRRPQPAWKGGVDEDLLYKQEVLSVHVPDENEDWMQLEMSKLSQFTRIYPLETRRDKIDGPGSALHQVDGEDVLAEGNDEENDEDEEESNQIVNAGDAGIASPNPKSSQKVATYDEILFQVFLQDKRQLMRLRCPLPNRTKADENSLPPLDSIHSSRSSSVASTTHSVKGAIGWKTPAQKAPAPKQTPRQLTQAQIDATKRLSQGLSVAATNSQTSRRGTNGYGNNNSSSQAALNIVLDPNEQNGISQYMNLFQNNADSNNNNNGHPYYIHDTSNEPIWPTTKAARLLEESRLNRMRLEAQRANNAAVLRQQLFSFDGQNVTGATTINGMLIHTNPDGMLAVSGSNANYTTAQTSNVVNGGQYPLENNQVIANPGNAQYVSSGASVASGTSTGMGGSVKINRTNAYPNANNNTKKRDSMSSIDNRQPQNGIISANNRANNNSNATKGEVNGNNSSQEEMLKQLFPSWF
eukprot:gene5590-7718_t